MLDIFLAYKRYPHHVPFRVKVFNVVRYFFRFPIGEKLIGQQLEQGRSFFRKFVPPVYFYKRESYRHAQREGSVLKLDLSQLIEHEIFFSNYRIPGFEKFLSLIPTDGIVFDIGANIGYCTLKFSKRCFEGRVYAFEPTQRNFSILSENIECNKVSNIDLVNLAVGEKQERAFIATREQNNAGASRIIGPHHNVAKGEQVSITFIDKFVNEKRLNRVDAIKIDVEGFELFVLRGAAETLRRFRPVLFIELSSVNLKEHRLKPEDVIQLLENFHYNFIDTRTLAPLRKIDADIHTDLICYPKTV